MVSVRGRLRGVNPVDVAALVGCLVGVGLVTTGYLMFRWPPPPVVERLTPSVVIEGASHRVRMDGDNLLPFYRVFLERIGGPDTVSFQIPRNHPSSQFALSDMLRADFVVESTRLAEITVPSGLLPGQYSVAVFDESRLVARGPSISVAPSSTGPPPERAFVRILGAFAALRPDAVRLLQKGARFPAAEQEIEIVEVQPAVGDTVRMLAGDKTTHASTEDRLQVPAIIRASCQPNNSRCLVGDVALEQHLDLKVTLPGGLASFVVEQVLPDEAWRRTFAAATVRVAAPEEILRKIQPGETDHPVASGPVVPASKATLRQVVLRGRTPAGAVADLEIELEAVTTGEQVWFRGHRIKPGVDFVFGPRDYTLHGTVVAVRLP